MKSNNGNFENAQTGKRFTNGTIDFIISNAGKLHVKSMANILHRTEKSIRRFAEKMGLSLRVTK